MNPDFMTCSFSSVFQFCVPAAIPLSLLWQHLGETSSTFKLSDGAASFQEPRPHPPLRNPQGTRSLRLVDFSLPDILQFYPLIPNYSTLLNLMLTNCSSGVEYQYCRIISGLCSRNWLDCLVILFSIFCQFYFWQSMEPLFTIDS